MKHDEKNGKQSCGERGGGGVEKEEEAEQSGTPAYLSAYKDGSLQRYMNCIVENGNLVEYIYMYIHIRNIEKF